ncbi:MAG: preprotein translocase subunit YajC [Flavobacteriales bacterium]|jgi:preprotein translocase subunit YajC
MSITLLQAQGAEGGMGTLLFMIGFFAIFFIFMIRPQMKKAKEQRKFQEGVKIGDRIMTIGGIHGEIIETDETTVVIKLDQGRMRIEKAALSATKQISEGQEK